MATKTTALGADTFGVYDWSRAGSSRLVAGPFIAEADASAECARRHASGEVVYVGPYRPSPGEVRAGWPDVAASAVWRWPAGWGSRRQRVSGPLTHAEAGAECARRTAAGELVQIGSLE